MKSQVNGSLSLESLALLLHRAKKSVSFEFDPWLSDLVKEGWFLRRKLGEGNTRIAYEAVRRETGTYQRAVIKILKPILGTSSAQTLINSSKNDNSQLESEVYKGRIMMDKLDAVKVLLEQATGKKLPSVQDWPEENWCITTRPFNPKNTQIIDNVTIEGFVDSLAIDEYVSVYGPITNPKEFGEISAQIVFGVLELWDYGKILHRDIKPSNILLTWDGGEVIFTDLANAKRYSDVTPQLLPTRGGTNYCDPLILKSFLQNEKTNSTLGSEYYSVGATLYYMLTGKNLFNFEFSADYGRGGNMDGNESNCFSFLDDGNVMDDISLDELGLRILFKLSSLPHTYQMLLQPCLDCWVQDSEERNYSKLFDCCENLKKGKPIQPREKLPDFHEVFGDGVISIDDSLFEKAVGIVREHGEFNRVVFFPDQQHEARLQLVPARRYTYSSNGLSIIVFDWRQLEVNGLWNATWDEKYLRHVDVYKGVDRFFSAKRILGRKKCSGGGGDFSVERIPSTQWEFCMKKKELMCGNELSLNIF